ncbi:hypothetical protein BC835DRAFT_919842 [Cytidiella melzeri]|nr:hypothetical protein BC835DRAFT_919842 [Cytidiella melzeri]
MGILHRALREACWILCSIEEGVVVCWSMTSHLDGLDARAVRVHLCLEARLRAPSTGKLLFVSDAKQARRCEGQTGRYGERGLVSQERSASRQSANHADLELSFGSTRGDWDGSQTALHDERATTTYTVHPRLGCLLSPHRRYAAKVDVDGGRGTGVSAACSRSCSDYDQAGKHDQQWP